MLIFLYRTADSGKNNKNGGRSQTRATDDQDKNDKGNELTQKKKEEKIVMAGQGIEDVDAS